MQLKGMLKTLKHPYLIMHINLNGCCGTILSNVNSRLKLANFAVLDIKGVL